MTRKSFTEPHPDLDEITKKLTAALVDQGKLVEAGWVSLKAMTLPKEAPPIQIEEMRNAFFAGAQHLFASIMYILDEDAEPTDADLRRIDNIQAELDAFFAGYFAAYVARRIPTAGSA